MKAFADLALFVLFASLLTRSGHGFASFSQLARRARVGEDKLRRTLAGCAEALQDFLIRYEGRRLVLTPIGLEFLKQSERLLAVGKNRPELDHVEVLTIAIAPAIGPQLLTRPVAEFFIEWADLIGLRCILLDPETIRESIAAGTVAFGLGFEADAIDTDVSKLESGLVWLLRVHHTHPLALRGSSVSATDLSTAGKVALPSEASRHLSALLSDVSTANRVEVESPLIGRALVEAGAAVAVELDLAPVADDPFCCQLPLEGADAVPLILHLPRNPSDLSEPANFMIEAIKRFMTEPRASAHPQETPVSKQADEPTTSPQLLLTSA